MRVLDLTEYEVDEIDDYDIYDMDEVDEVVELVQIVQIGVLHDKLELIDENQHDYDEQQFINHGVFEEFLLIVDDEHDILIILKLDELVEMLIEITEVIVEVEVDDELDEVDDYIDEI